MTNDANDPDEQDRKDSQDRLTMASELAGTLGGMVCHGELRSPVTDALLWLIEQVQRRTFVYQSLDISDDHFSVSSEVVAQVTETACDTTLVRESASLEHLIAGFFGDYEIEDLPKLAAELRRLANRVDQEILSRLEPR